MAKVNKAIYILCSVYIVPETDKFGKLFKEQRELWPNLLAICRKWMNSGRAGAEKYVHCFIHLPK
ncbi:hypothetical protein C4565_09625 [Candidatus Parcubacteria bacterium]|nr:MAG: hypothetical protein C4565_09625 [Candidatus Parcubacteria bacterium]